MKERCINIASITKLEINFMKYADMPTEYGDSHYGNSPYSQPYIPYQPNVYTQQQQQNTYTQQPRRPAAQTQQARPKQAARMPKEQALALVDKMKKGLAVGSLLCFGVVGGLIINHTTSTTSHQTSTTGQSTTPATTSSSGTSAGQSTSSSNTSSGQSTTSSSNGSSSQSFPQQAGSYGFGSQNSNQQGVSGSSVS
jgi:hypothetical protein